MSAIILPPVASVRLVARAVATTALGLQIDEELPGLLARALGTTAGQAAARLVARDPARWVLLVGDAHLVRRCTPDALPDEGEAAVVAYREGAVALLHQERRLATARRVSWWRPAGPRRLQLVAITRQWADASDAILDDARPEVPR